MTGETRWHPPKWMRTLRFQVAFWYVVTLFAILVIIGACVYWGIWTNAVRDTDRAIAAEIAAITGQLRDEDSDERPNKIATVEEYDKRRIAERRDEPYVVVRDTNTGRVVYASPDLTDPTVLAALASMPSSASDRVACSFAGRHEETRVRAASVALPTGSHDLIVAVPWDRSEDFLLKTLLVIATVISVFLAISSVGAWLLVGRSLAPIDQIVTVAEHLSADSLSPHLLPASAVSDSEVGHVVAALNDMMARLYDSFERQKRFTADASHELRMPLTVLQGEIELGLARERSNEELCDILRSSLEETHRLTDIVESLSALAIADVGVLSARERSESVDLDKLCREVVTTFGNRASEKNVALGYETAGSAVTVIGNSDSLRRLVNNLVQNGIAYTDSGGAVTVTLSTENGSASIVVRDTGIGISAADLPHIFERFYRADKARSNAGGAGLGLSIVASIVKAHRGTVAVKSEVGHGSEFHVALPLA